MGLASTIALRSLLQKPGRTFFSVAGIAVGIATVVGIFTLDHNTLLGRTRGAESEWEAEIEVRPSRKVENPRGELEEMSGIVGVTAAFQKVAAVRPAGQSTPGTSVQLVAIEPDAAASLEALQLLEGAPLTADQSGGVLIGRAVAEAVHAGCYPVLPREQVYPSLYGTRCKGRHFYEDEEGLVNLLRDLLTGDSCGHICSLDRDVDGCCWPLLAPRFDTLIDEVCSRGRLTGEPRTHWPEGSS